MVEGAVVGAVVLEAVVVEAAVVCAVSLVVVVVELVLPHATSSGTSAPMLAEMMIRRRTGDPLCY